MPYAYQAGDYYRGDYYRGDFLGIGKALKGAAGAVGKVLGGVSKVVGGLGIPVVSGVARAVGTIVSSGPSPYNQTPTYINPPAMMSFNGGGGGGGGGPMPAMPVPGLGGAISRILPGGESGYQSSQGYHWSKTAEKWVKNRHMNPTNVRALRRSGRRIKGFLRIAGRLGALPVNRGKGKRLFKRKSR